MFKKPKLLSTPKRGTKLGLTYLENNECEEEEFPIPVIDQIPIEFKSLSEQYSKTNQFCWGCHVDFGLGKGKSKCKIVNEIQETYGENKDTMSDEELCNLISNVYNLKVRIPELANGNKSPHEWSPELVSAHINHHMLDNKRNQSNTIRDLTVTEAILKDSLFFIHPDTKKRTIDVAAFKEYKDILKIKQSIQISHKNLT